MAIVFLVLLSQFNVQKVNIIRLLMDVRPAHLAVLNVKVLPNAQHVLSKDLHLQEHNAHQNVEINL